MRRIILKAYCSNDNYNYEADFAVVELDPPYIELLFRRMDAALQLANEWRPHVETKPNGLGSLYYLSFWEVGAFFITEPTNETEDATGFEAMYGDEVTQYLESREHFLEPEQAVPPEFEGPSTEMDTIRVLPDQVYWHAMPKHGGDELSTARLNRQDLEEYALAMGLRGKPTPVKETKHGRRGKARKRRRSAGG